MMYSVSNSPEDFLANVIYSKISTGLWLTNGPSGSRIRTWCTKVAAQAWAFELIFGGFVSPTAFQDGKMIDVDLLNVATREEWRLGNCSGDTGKITIGCWQMDESILAWVNEIIGSQGV